MTNCTDRFPCPLNTWGVMEEGLELAAQPWDATWRCLDLSAAGAPVEASRCADLARSSRAFFARLPNGAENRESY